MANKVSLNYEKLNSKRELGKIRTRFARQGLSVVSISTMDKPKRQAGVKYKAVVVTFADSQAVELRVKTTGDIYQARLNTPAGRSKEVPIKNQEDHEKAIKEIAGMIDKRIVSFQKALAKRRSIEIPTGIKRTSTNKKVKLIAKRDELDKEITATEAEIARYREVA